MSTYIAAGGYKYCKICAAQKLGAPRAKVIMSMEFLQVLREVITVPPRMSGQSAKEIYTNTIFKGILHENEIAEVVFRKTFHMDESSHSLIWPNIQTQITMSEVLEKVLIRLYGMMGKPAIITDDILIKL